jgi:N-acetylglutamate synthase-like GNAT family acetyltransferase
VKVIDLTSEHQKLYFMCLEEWSEDIKEAGDHKECWYGRMKDRGLNVKLAEDDSGTIGGMIQYVPVEQSIIDGKDLYFIYCIWVHGHKQGRGNLQKRGMGKALLNAAEADAKALGAKGMAAWGVSLPFFMRASWFKKHGYKKADRQGIQVLLWKPFTADAVPPKWIRRKKAPELIPGKVTVSAFKNGWCPALNLAFERTKRAASGFGDIVAFKEYDTFDRETLSEWGISDSLFVNGKEIRNGPPPKYEKIKAKIEKSLKRLK